MIDRTLGLRDKNGKELHDGDTVMVEFFDRRPATTGRVHYDKAQAAWMIGNYYILNIGRDQGTVIEVVKSMQGVQEPAKRRKGKAS